MTDALFVATAIATGVLGVVGLLCLTEKDLRKLSTGKFFFVLGILSLCSCIFLGIACVLVLIPKGIPSG